MLKVLGGHRPWISCTVRTNLQGGRGWGEPLYKVTDPVNEIKKCFQGERKDPSGFTFNSVHGPNS